MFLLMEPAVQSRSLIAAWGDQLKSEEFRNNRSSLMLEETALGSHSGDRPFERALSFVNSNYLFILCYMSIIYMCHLQV